MIDSGIKISGFFPRNALVALFFIIPLISGCARYSSLESLYSGNKNTTDAFTTYRNKELAIKAGQIQHPLLRPVEIDFSNGISIDEAAIVAVVANPSLKTERDRKKIAEAQLIQAGLLPNPQFSLSLEFPTAGFTKDTFTAYGFGLDWDITSLVTRGARLSSARSNKASINLEVAWKEWQTAECARLHWARLYWSQKKKKLLEGWAGALRKRVKVLSEAVDHGVETAPVLASAKTTFLEAMAGIAETSEHIQKESAALKLLLGLPPDHDLILQELGFKVPLSEDVMIQMENAAETFMNRRLDIMALRAACKSRDQAVREAVLSQFPRIGVGILHARDTGNIITTGPSVNIEIPFFDRGQGQIAIARALRSQAIDEYRARIFEAKSKVEEIKKRICCLNKYYLKVSQAAAARQDMVRIYQEALARGTVDVLTYYQAMATLFEQRVKLIDIKTGITELMVAMESLTGTHLYLTDTISCPKHQKIRGEKPPKT